MAKSTTQPKPFAETKFHVGDWVRVRQRVIDSDYPDIPLGGWVGQVFEVLEGGRLYAVRWSSETLDAIHPVVKKRCEKEGLAAEEYYLEEGDLEADPGGLLQIEQPTEIKTKLLNPEARDDRIRMVFGLTSDDPLPKVCMAALLIYHQYLTENMPFPFEGEYVAKTSPGETEQHVVKVTGLPDPNEYDCNEMYGLMCEVREGRRKWQVPLIEIEVQHDRVGVEMLADYDCWFQNRG